MKIYGSKLIRIAGVGIMAVILFLATIGFARTVYAQDNNGNPTILQAVQAIQNTLASLGTTLPSIGTTLVAFQNAVSPPSQENVRFTPPVFPSVSDFVTCEVVNVNRETRTVRLQLIDALGTVRQDSDNIPVGAGNARELRGLSPVPTVVMPVYCKFTVVDGSRTDIRGAVEIFPVTAPGGDKLTVPAE